jgi:hypothetical protein
MNVKCISTTVTVFPLFGTPYDRDLSEYITKGNVYETTGNFGQQYFHIRHDHGSISSEFPTYCFQATNDPVTSNPNREQEIKDAAERQRQLTIDSEKEKEQQRISDNMERYYNPKGFKKIQEQRARVQRTFSDVFVGGLPYDNY